jgi:hypothetical protein
MIRQTVSDHLIFDKLGLGSTGGAFCARDTKARRDSRKKGRSTET